jgi:hypothetical protein
MRCADDLSYTFDKRRYLEVFEDTLRSLRLLCNSSSSLYHSTFVAEEAEARFHR